MSKMLTSGQLATITIRRVIFHDVPRQKTPTTLSDTETTTDPIRLEHLRSKLRQVLGAKTTYPAQFGL
jgi:hypothetical protein